jgi:pimeloyl-ACP methyl ester carboxylesterase
LTSKSGYAPVNGLQMYYEVHGEGWPLFLMHGGAGATEMFSGIIKPLSEGHQVILADLQAHGRTADIDRPLRYELMGDDIAALARHLHLAKVDLMGYSLGAGAAVRTAIQHPDLVRKLVVVSTPFKRDGWYPEVKEAMSQGSPESAEAMKQSPMYEMYSRIAPRREDWPVLFTKLGEMLRQDYDWSTEVKKIRAQTMIVIGDADSVRPEHAVEFFQLLGGGKEDAGWDGSKMPRARLAIIPGVTHYNIFASPALVSTVRPFLDSPAP